MSTAEDNKLLEGYNYNVLFSWGDPILKGASNFSVNNTAKDQLGRYYIAGNHQGSASCNTISW